MQCRIAVVNSMGRETMADNHGVATVDDDLDLDSPAHEATYVQFLFTVQLTIVVLVCHLLLLVLWGLEGHPIVALIGFILTMVSAVVGALTGLGWKSVAPVSCCSDYSASYCDELLQAGGRAMLIGVVAETHPRETRVAATPETVKKFIALGAEVAVEAGAGDTAEHRRRRLCGCGRAVGDARGDAGGRRYRARRAGARSRRA